MSLDASALGSISYTLDDLVRRIGEVADGATEDDEALGELREVERQLQTSVRRLNKVVRRIQQ
ncbi:MAG: hypothetical protein AAGD35_14490 [Actinomycetota bacterium]